MTHRHSHNNLTWIDLESPTDSELAQVVGEYDIHPAVAVELATPSLKPKVDLYHNFIYLILHFPSPKPAAGGVQEIDFIVGKNFLITTRYESIEPIYKFAKVFEVSSVLAKKNIGDHAGYLFYFLVRELYSTLEDRLEFLQNQLGDIETKVFEGQEREMVFAISELSRELLDFKHAMTHHREVLESFEIAGKSFFGENFSYYLRSIVGEYYKVNHTIRSSLESLTELRETNNSLLTTKQNTVIQILTVIAIIALPLTIITSLFQIETVARPIVGHPNDFWILVGLLFTISGLLFLLFKRKSWL